MRERMSQDWSCCSVAAKSFSLLCQEYPADWGFVSAKKDQERRASVSWPETQNVWDTD